MTYIFNFKSYKTFYQCNYINLYPTIYIIFFLLTFNVSKI